MKQDIKTGIGFENFRRFQDFPLLEFGPITYMVGRNNAGKSTAVKALLLMLDYLKYQMSDSFAFDNIALEDANIVTFERAINSKSIAPYIQFQLQLGKFNTKIELSGIPSSTRADVNNMVIGSIEDGYILTINYNSNKIGVYKKEVSVEAAEVDYEKNMLKVELEDLERNLKNRNNKLSNEALQLADRINKIKDRLKQYDKPKVKEINTEYLLEYPLESFSQRVKSNELDELATDLVYKNHLEYRNSIKSRDNKNLFEEDIDENILNFENDKNNFLEWVESYLEVISNFKFYYLGANPSKQSALFSIRAKDNALAQAIHEYHQLRVGKGEEEELFIRKWMEEFEVGDDFKIELYAGEAYEFYVYDKDNPSHLADKGMGSLQAMMIILRIASLILKHKKSKDDITIVVEEPELNLHPALQAKITDLLHEVYEKYQIKFVIETHSEYMIRKSQLIGLKEDYFSNQGVNPNPFKVYYFHKEEGPYEMKYTKQGRFERDFGKGFYDEAGKIAMEAIKLGRKK